MLYLEEQIADRTLTVQHDLGVVGKSGEWTKRPGPYSVVLSHQGKVECYAICETRKEMQTTCAALRAQL